MKQDMIQQPSMNQSSTIQPQKHTHTHLKGERVFLGTGKATNRLGSPCPQKDLFYSCKDNIAAEQCNLDRKIR